MKLGGARGARVVLVGAGHGHLGVLLRARRLRAVGLRVTLVSPPSFRYSGLASGVLSGRFAPGDGQIDVGGLAQRMGVEYLPAEVIAVNRAARRVALDDGREIGFDLLSLNVGSAVERGAFGTEAEGVWSAKPLDSLLRLREQVEADIASSGAAPRILVAGAGQTGLETAAALSGLARRRGVTPDVVVVGDLRPPRGTNATGWRRLQAHLAVAGVPITEGRVVAWENRSARLDCGHRLAARHLVLATGLVAHPLAARLGLSHDADGRLIVDATLRAPGDRRVFSVGDCAVMAADWRPMVGVFGVRSAPILAHNLAAACGAAPYRRFHAQRRWLSIMDLGDGTGFAMRGPWWRLGRETLWLKTALDRAFLRRLSGAA